MDFFCKLEQSGVHQKSLSGFNRTQYFRIVYIYILLGMYQVESDTPWKFNIDPQILPSKRECGLPTIIFRGELLNLGGVFRVPPKIRLKLTQPMAPWNKSLNFIFPIKYGIPKSLIKFSH